MTYACSFYIYGRAGVEKHMNEKETLFKGGSKIF